MLDEILREGFALANRRLGLVLLDTVWKAIWLALTGALLVVLISWYGSQLQTLAWEDTGVPAINAVLAAALLREFWDANKWELYWALAAVIAASTLVWFFLEALFRSRYVVAGFGCSLKVFLASAAVRLLVLIASAFTLGLISAGPFLTAPFAEWPGLWLDTRGAVVAAFVAFLSLAFLVTLLDTLVRSDAIGLLGKDLIRVSLMLGILMLFEAMAAASIAAAVVAGFLNVGRMSEAIAMLGAAGVGVVFLSVLHSYLLLVRFSAVDIMRRADSSGLRRDPRCSEPMW